MNFDVAGLVDGWSRDLRRLQITPATHPAKASAAEASVLLNPRVNGHALSNRSSLFPPKPGLSTVRNALLGSVCFGAVRCSDVEFLRKAPGALRLPGLRRPSMYACRPRYSSQSTLSTITHFSNSLERKNSPRIAVGYVSTRTYAALSLRNMLVTVTYTSSSTFEIWAGAVTE